MRPAFSLIFFTSLSGLGFGLAAILGLGLISAPSGFWWLVQNGTALLLIAAGLLSSTLHLGHPERAWRALSQWRSSWLSREGVLAGITCGCLFLYAVFGYIHDGLTRNELISLGLVVTVLSLLTIWCTAMIYASLKTVARWHHPLTPFVFISYGMAGGGMLATGLDIMARDSKASFMTGLTLIALAAAAVVSAVWSRRAGAKGSGSTPESATGLGQFGAVRMLMPPHSEENWLQHEMGFMVARKHAQTLQRISFILGVIIPALVLVASSSAAAVMAAAVIHLAGVMTSRWLFFAEAKHTVMLYYGERH
jgi:DMSO reductase anchor subunit